MNALVPHDHDFRMSTDAAGLCGDIVKKTASNIQGRRYVSVEGWQAIAIAHGCAAGARDVEKVEGGVRAIGEIRRMSDGQIIAVAEGFVGEDEPTWYGGSNGRGRILPKRADYAIRAMAQTRAISRACRSAFAHVVVMIDAGLSTTPAEEVPDGGFVEGQFQEVAPAKEGGMPDAEWANLVQLVEATKADTQAMLKHFGVQSLRHLNQDQYGKAIASLKSKLAKMAKEETNAKAREQEPAGEFAELDADSIPY